MPQLRQVSASASRMTMPASTRWPARRALHVEVRVHLRASRRARRASRPRSERERARERARARARHRFQIPGREGERERRRFAPLSRARLAHDDAVVVSGRLDAPSSPLTLDLVDVPPGGAAQLAHVWLTACLDRVTRQRLVGRDVPRPGVRGGRRGRRGRAREEGWGESRDSRHARFASRARPARGGSRSAEGRGRRGGSHFSRSPTTSGRLEADQRRAVPLLDALVRRAARLLVERADLLVHRRDLAAVRRLARRELALARLRRLRAPAHLRDVGRAAASCSSRSSFSALRGAVLRRAVARVVLDLTRKGGGGARRREAGGALSFLLPAPTRVFCFVFFFS